MTFLINLNAARKQTRQWAAWTRQEEESFFTALRQVGKVCVLSTGDIIGWQFIFLSFYTFSFNDNNNMLFFLLATEFRENYFACPN